MVVLIGRERGEDEQWRWKCVFQPPNFRGSQSGGEGIWEQGMVHEAAGEERSFFGFFLTVFVVTLSSAEKPQESGRWRTHMS
jgi:hypothetical protein